MIRCPRSHRLIFLFVLLPLGCGDGKPDNVPISGKVVYANGKPLTGGMIVFNPLKEGETAPLAAIQQDGTFEISARGGGISPGEYKVSLAPAEGETAPAREERSTSSFPVPEKYLQASTSGWTATVKEGRNEPFTFTIRKR